MISARVEGGQELELLLARLRTAQSGKLGIEVAKRAAPALALLVDEEFSNGMGPTGKAWKTVKYRSGSPLFLSGALRASAVPRAEGDTVVINSDLPYSRIHNQGGVVVAKRAKALRFVINGQVIFRKSVKIPKRQFVPGSTLPYVWFWTMTTITSDVFTEVVGVSA